MSEQEEKDAFEERLREDPNDLVTRKVFADWLDEHDLPELADWHRRWPQSEIEEMQRTIDQLEYRRNDGCDSCYSSGD